MLNLDQIQFPDSSGEDLSLRRELSKSKGTTSAMSTLVPEPPMTTQVKVSEDRGHCSEDSHAPALTKFRVHGWRHKTGVTAQHGNSSLTSGQMDVALSGPNH